MFEKLNKDEVLALAPKVIDEATSGPLLKTGTLGGVYVKLFRAAPRAVYVCEGWGTLFLTRRDGIQAGRRRISASSELVLITPIEVGGVPVVWAEGTWRSVMDDGDVMVEDYIMSLYMQKEDRKS